MRNKASILELSAASRSFSCRSSFVRCSMSYTGRQFNNSYGEDFVYASKRRQGGKVER